MNPSSSSSQTPAPTQRVVLLERTKPLTGTIAKTPAWKTIAYTLNISMRFLAKAAVGQGSVQYGDGLLDWYWRSILSAGNATLSAEGRENFEKGKPYLIMSNHCSLVDIPAIMGASPSSVRMVTKQELVNIPVWGHALEASGFIAVDRKNREKAIQQLDKAKKVLSQGVCVWISPEGTRSRINSLAPFKKGGFHIAIDMGIPIIPTWIEGAYDVMPPDSFMTHYDKDIVVKFGKPIDTAGKTKDDIDTLMKDVRTAMIALSGRQDLQ